MSAITTFVTKHPAADYFALTFVMSWGGVSLILSPLDISGAHIVVYSFALAIAVWVAVGVVHESACQR